MKREKIKAIHIIVVTIVTIAVRKIFSSTRFIPFFKARAPLNIGSFTSLIFWFDCTNKHWDHSTYNTPLALHASSISDNTTLNKTKPKN